MNDNQITSILASINSQVAQMSVNLATVKDQNIELIDTVEAQNVKIDCLAEENKELVGEVKEVKLQNLELRTDLHIVKKQNGELIDTVEAQSVKIDLLTEENKELKVTVKAQAVKIETLQSEVSRLTEENIELRKRVDSIEDRLALLDEQLTGIAPMVRDLLQEEMSLLLDPEYFSELRDQESIRSFRSAKFIVKNWSSDSDWGQYLSHFKNDRGIVTAFGKSLKQFYQTVTSHAPRHEKAVYQYWLEAEEIIVSNAMRLFKGMFA